MSTKKPKKEQKYEKYWKITLEYTDFFTTPKKNSGRFIGTLKIIKKFIDENSKEKYSKKKYERLRDIVNKKYPKSDMGSVRKSINGNVKLGFIEPKLAGCHPLTNDFLKAKTIKKRQRIFSKIVYSNSCLNCSVKNERGVMDDPNGKINFLLETMYEVGKLTKKEILALMMTDLSKYKKGFLNKNELACAVKKANKDKFLERKYNQHGHFIAVLRNLEDIKFQNNNLYDEKDAKKLFPDENGRPVYLQKQFTNDLVDEVCEMRKEDRCMVVDRPDVGLVSSHIIPWMLAPKEIAFHRDNGLRLSQDMDIKFDHGYISFEDNGKMIISDRVPIGQKKYLLKEKYGLHKTYINKNRKEYLKYHREIIFRNENEKKEKIEYSEWKGIKNIR